MLSSMQIVYLYLLTTPVFFAIDMVWLGFIAKDLYSKQLGSLLTDNVNWVAAIIFYLFYIAGILYFVVLPGLDKGSLTQVIINGALLGGLAYMTYDLTNLATLKGWPLQIVFIDIVWGMVLTASVASAGYYIGQWLS